MEIVTYLLCFFAGAFVTMIVQRPAERPAERAREAPKQDDAADVELIRQWANLLRYDGKEQRERD